MQLINVLLVSASRAAKSGQLSPSNSGHTGLDATQYLSHETKKEQWQMPLLFLVTIEFPLLAHKSLV